MLNPVPELSFYEGLHRYRYKGEWLAESASSVIGSALDPVAAARIASTKDGPDGWAKRGKDIHAWFDGFLRGEEKEAEERWAEWLAPIRELQLFSNFELLACEYPLCDSQRSVGGTLDFLIRVKTDEPEKDWPVVLGDLKTVGSRRGVSSRRPATAQLGAYLRMLGEHHSKLWVTECVTVVAGPERSRVISQTPDECAAAWEDAWGVFDAATPDF